MPLVPMNPPSTTEPVFFHNFTFIEVVESFCCRATQEVHIRRYYEHKPHKCVFYVLLGAECLNVCGGDFESRVRFFLLLSTSSLKVMPLSRVTPWNLVLSDSRTATLLKFIWGISLSLFGLFETVMNKVSWALSWIFHLL